MGLSPHANRNGVTVYLPESLAAATLANLAANQAIAITLSRASDLKTLQLKGTSTKVRTSAETDPSLGLPAVRDKFGEPAHPAASQAGTKMPRRAARLPRPGAVCSGAGSPPHALRARIRLMARSVPQEGKADRSKADPLGMTAKPSSLLRGPSSSDMTNTWWTLDYPKLPSSRSRAGKGS